MSLQCRGGRTAGTPPDVFSQLALPIAIVLRYEVGIIAAGVFIKHTRAPDEDALKA